MSFIETKHKYVYMEVGSRKYATVVVDKKKGVRSSANNPLNTSSVLQQKVKI